nr:protein kinase [Lachnospiraceae bacterium]
MKKSSIPKNLLQAGMTLADRRYRVDELLGDNGLTVTYKGYDTFRKKVVAIRELFPQSILKRDIDHDYRAECKKMSDEELFRSMKEHMVRRAKKMIGLYPVEGIANVLTYLEERETVYAIEEYVEGQTLENKLWKRHSAKFLPEDLLQYLLPVMDTLMRLHGHGVFHGTVYPENIRLTGDGKVVLVGIMNPMEDIAAPQLGDIALRKDAFSPVELYVPEAKRGASIDIYEVGAVFYRYVTGEPLPVYYDRINEEKKAEDPVQMKTRVMKFQSEAIMKAVAVYDFERYETMQQFKSALCPEDVDYEQLNSKMSEAKTFSKEALWYKHQKKARNRYVWAVAVMLLFVVVVLGPGLAEVGKDVLVNRFYKTFTKADVAKQYTMLADMSGFERSLYTNNYVDVDDTLSDEEKSEQAEIKYYDFQLEKCVTQDKFDVSSTCYEYIKIDYHKDEVWINYMTELGNELTTMKLVPNMDGKYEVKTTKIDRYGKVEEEIVYVKYTKKK